MMGELLDYDPDTRTLTGRFPVMARYKNPYKVMQGGMIAAAMDNVLGPLSVLVAPANLTREMIIKYKKPVSEEFAYIVIKAWVEKLEPPYLWLAARVESEDGVLFARAKARHFILEHER
jgi:acyl-coenzyme A thioesterase PaaI-like protein